MSENDKRRLALITGISGGLAQQVAEVLAGQGFEIVGVDYRAVPDEVPHVAALYQANYNKTKIEDIFRRHRPSHVLHLGRVGNLKERMGKRFDLNVIGSRKVMDLAQKYGARRLIVLSTFHIYGAHPHNHIPIAEDEPLRAGQAFPQIADAIQLDNQAVAWLYRNADVPTVLFRPCNVVGPLISNAMSRFLRQPTKPVIMGFNPMSQFIHERDLVSAIVRASERDARGVFNIAGRGTIPVRDAIDIAGGTQIPVPAGFAAAVLRAARMVMPALPPYLINFFKYPAVITDDAFREAFDWEPEIGQVEAVRSTVGI